VPDAVAAIEFAWGDLMRNLGYELVSMRTEVSVAGSHRGLPS